VHIRNSPWPHASNGHFRFGASTGILPAALAANSEVFQFRWAHAAKFAVITKVVIAASVTTTMFAAGVPVEIDAIKSTGWSAQGTGGTGVTMGALGKLRSGFASSVLAAGDMRIATTAALGAGTKALETGVPLAVHVAGGPITASLNGTIFPATELIYVEPDKGEYPLILGGQGGGANSEGFSIRSVAVPATGTWRLSVTVQWAEVDAF
jgi:hypothetical protein